MNVTRLLLSFVSLAALAAPAAAQNHYVGASLAGDIARFTRTSSLQEILVVDDESPDGEALGLGLSGGTTLGERWGIDLEFVWPARIEHTIRRRFPVTLPAPIPLPGPIPIPIPSLDFEIAASQRHTTLTASVWVRQEVSDRLALAYLAGVTFSRMEFEQSLNFGILQSLPVPMPRIDVVEHGVGPAIGVEGRVKLGDHVAIVPSMRLHAVKLAGDSGWLMRPAIGARWLF